MLAYANDLFLTLFYRRLYFITAIKKDGFIVNKSDERVFVTAPVLVPGDRDCDFDNGELPLTAEKVRNIAYSFLEYGIIDKNHDYFPS